MPIIEIHRGVGCHGFQNRERVETIVKPAIDSVFQLTDLHELLAFAEDRANPPEARALAADKIRAAHDLRSAAHHHRGAIDLQFLAAVVAGVDSLNWASPSYYGSALAAGDPPRAPRRAAPRPADQRERLLAAKRAAVAGDRYAEDDH